MSRHWRISAFQIGTCVSEKGFHLFGWKKEGGRKFKKSLDDIKKYVCTRTHIRELLGVSIPGALPCWIGCLCYENSCCFLLSLQDITKRHFVWTSKFASEQFSWGKNPWELWLYMYARTRKQEMYQVLGEKRGECLQSRKGSQYFFSMYLLVHCSLTSFPQPLLPLDFYQQTITLPTPLKLLFLIYSCFGFTKAFTVFVISLRSPEFSCKFL